MRAIHDGISRPERDGCRAIPAPGFASSRNVSPEAIATKRPLACSTRGNCYLLLGEAMFDRPDGRSPEYWRDMADEARTLADGLVTEVNRQQMLAVAENYERLAEQAERARAHSSPSFAFSFATVLNAVAGMPEPTQRHHRPKNICDQPGSGNPFAVR